MADYEDFLPSIDDRRQRPAPLFNDSSGVESTAAAEAVGVALYPVVTWFAGPSHVVRRAANADQRGTRRQRGRRRGAGGRARARRTPPPPPQPVDRRAGRPPVGGAGRVVCGPVAAPVRRRRRELRQAVGVVSGVSRGRRCPPPPLRHRRLVSRPASAAQTPPTASRCRCLVVQSSSVVVVRQEQALGDWRLGVGLRYGHLPGVVPPSARTPPPLVRH